MLLDVHLLKEHSCQILSRSDFKRRTFKHFWKGYPKKNRNNKMSSNMRSDPNLRNTALFKFHTITYFYYLTKQLQTTVSIISLLYFLTLHKM